MIRLVRPVLATLCALVVATGALAAPFEQERDAVDPFGGPPPDVVQVDAVWNVDRIAPGGQAVLGIVVDIAHGFHINADVAQIDPAAEFQPYASSVRVLAADQALTIETVRFPRAVPVRATYADEAIPSFEDRTVFYLPMRLTETDAGEVSVTVQFEYQACDSVNCLLPATVDLTRSLPVAAGGEAVASINEDLFAGFATAGAAGSPVFFDLFGLDFTIDASSGAGLALLWIIAILGGALLNFTPCVLPVIPIKIMGLSHAAEGNRGRAFLLGTVMSLGVIAFWVALGVLIATVAGFTATNQLFQYPAFTIGVGLVIAFMAVAMTGVFFIQLPQSVYRFNPGQETMGGSFGFGIMTAILSTPCTAPFMGAAAAWAATQSPVITLSTFLAIGVGMALPYFVLSANPGLLARMPRTGPASELIKQVMGLFMLAAAAYFVGSGLSAVLIDPPDPPSRFYWWVVMAFVAAGGVWLTVRTWQLTAAPLRRALFGGLGVFLAVAAVGGGLRLTDDGPIEWVYYTPARFEEALAGGQVVVMDFTAEWCLNCKSLEHGVLHKADVVALLNGEGVVPIKVDITGRNPEGKAKLKDVGRLTIPLLVVFSPDGTEVFKSDFYTADQVKQAVAQAGQTAEYVPGR